VDDEKNGRELVRLVLEDHDFEVVEAGGAREAMEKLSEARFDVLLTDLHMPSAGDGLTVVSAMRHFNPDAVTLILSGFPEMERATAAILAQADGILVKPVWPRNLIDTIQAHLRKAPVDWPQPASVATILEEGVPATIADWLRRADNEPELMAIKMTDAERSAHLPQLFHDLVVRLRIPQALGVRASASPSAADHGMSRRMQGYTAAMMVEESRMLQVIIFQTLQNNLFRVNFSQVLESVMTIADEVDSQLAQAMSSYIAESEIDTLPTLA